MDDGNAAHDLLGRTLSSGWRVFDKIHKDPTMTGSFFSVCYRVEKDGEIGFLKAFDFMPFFQLSTIPGRSIVDVLQEMVTAYQYERDLSDLCREKHITKVVIVKDAGEENVPGHTIPIVPYLVFDMADGDIRARLAFSNSLDAVWKLKAIHSVAVGLKQLHAINVSHQDLKPSNVLLFHDESKIGDLGRAPCVDIESRYKKMPYTGDLNYASPEILYEFYEKDWRVRSFAIDCYLLGSMLVFCFTGISMTALLRTYIPDEFGWERYRGPFDAIKPYVIDAFAKSLDKFESSIDILYLREELRRLVECLCHPFPEKRGHPKNVGSVFDQYNLERVISQLDMLYRKAKYRLYPHR
jgi:serine/threonine protein kinase